MWLRFIRNSARTVEFQMTKEELIERLEKNNPDLKVFLKSHLDECLKDQINSAIKFASLISSHETDKYSRVVDELLKALKALR